MNPYINIIAKALSKCSNPEVMNMSRETRYCITESYSPLILQEISGVPVEIDDTMGLGKVTILGKDEALLVCFCKYCLEETDISPIT